MSLAEYDDITVGQFFNAWSGLIEWQSEKEKQEWERMNYVAYSMLANNAYIKKQDKPKSFEEFMKAGKKEQKQLTKQEFENFLT